MAGPYPRRTTQQILEGQEYVLIARLLTFLPIVPSYMAQELWKDQYDGVPPHQRKKRIESELHEIERQGLIRSTTMPALWTRIVDNSHQSAVQINRDPKDDPDFRGNGSTTRHRNRIPAEGECRPMRLYFCTERVDTFRVIPPAVVELQLSRDAKYLSDNFHHRGAIDKQTIQNTFANIFTTCCINIAEIFKQQFANWQTTSVAGWGVRFDENIGVPFATRLQKDGLHADVYVGGLGPNDLGRIHNFFREKGFVGYRFW